MKSLLSAGVGIVAGEIGQKSARLGWRFGGCFPATIVPGNNCAGASLFSVSVASCAQAFRRRSALEEKRGPGAAVCLFCRRYNDNHNNNV